MYSECPRFHSNWFTFGGVIAESVNTAKTLRSEFNIRLKPIFEPNNEDQNITETNNILSVNIQLLWVVKTSLVVSRNTVWDEVSRTNVVYDIDHENVSSLHYHLSYAFTFTSSSSSSSSSSLYTTTLKWRCHEKQPLQGHCTMKFKNR